MSNAISAVALATFEQKPHALVRFVDPVLQDTRAGYVSIFFTNGMGLMDAPGEGYIVVAQFGQHILVVNEVGVVIQNALKL
jgi:hypothetical protein